MTNGSEHAPRESVFFSKAAVRGPLDVLRTNAIERNVFGRGSEQLSHSKEQEEAGRKVYTCYLMYSQPAAPGFTWLHNSTAY